MRSIIKMGLLLTLLLVACGVAEPSQPMSEGQTPTLVTVFKPPT